MHHLSPVNRALRGSWTCWGFKSEILKCHFENTPSESLLALVTSASLPWQSGGGGVFWKEEEHWWDGRDWKEKYKKGLFVMKARSYCKLGNDNHQQNSADASVAAVFSRGGYFLKN